MRLSKKLPLAAGILTVLVIGATSLASLTISTSTSHQLVEDKLKAVAVGTQNEVQAYLAGLEQDVRAKAADPEWKKAYDWVSFGWTALGENAEAELQRRYITENPNPTGEKHLYETANIDGYDSNHSKFHPAIREHMEKNGYYDIFLINLQGDIIYSVYKELDFATNLVDGPYKDSGLAEVFNEVMAQGEVGKIAFSDFKPYAPSADAPAAFIAAPIMAPNGPVAVVAFQMPIDRINQIMARDRNLGNDGETLLINAKGQLLNDSTFTEANDTLNVTLTDPFVTEAVKNQSVSVQITDTYRGMSADIAVAGFTFEGAKWGIAAVMSVDEALAGVTTMRYTIGAIALLALALALAAAVFFSRSLTRPIDQLVERMKALAEGDTSIDLDDGNRNDEISEMVRAVGIFRDAAIDKVALEGKAEEERNLSDQERREREAQKSAEAQQIQQAVDALGAGLKELARGNLTRQIDTPFTGELESLRQDFNASIAQLKSTLTEVSSGTSSIQADSHELRSAADNLSRRTEQQAASLEETSAALDEITATVNNSTERAQEATRLVGEAKTSTESSSQIVADAVNAMSRIENASEEISKIISVIDEIAFQTNLLALNAGVEAARAGEAGKGFAVVAQEVRELAQRAASAAKEIKDLITKSGEEVTGGVSLVQATGEALGEIASHVDIINEHINSIATAAEEQATGLREINSAVNAMDQVTQQNAAMVEETNAVTHRLSDGTNQLMTLVDRFEISGGVTAAVGEYREAG